MKFYKMQAIGNDFIVTSYDEIEFYLNDLEKNIKKMCDRRFGIGADGLIFFSESNKADIKMNFYNADGTRASMCGNGIRCLSKYIYDTTGRKSDEILIETDDGIKKINIVENLFSVDMGQAEFNYKSIPCIIEKDEIINEEINVLGRKFLFSCVKVGVPHVVIICDEMLSDEEINSYGKELEKHHFFPKRANINFIEVKNRKEVYINSYERGAGRTLGCGTGCCAAHVILTKLNKIDEEAAYFSDGGNIKIYYDKSKNILIMKGDAKVSFIGEYNA